LSGLFGITDVVEDMKNLPNISQNLSILH